MGRAEQWLGLLDSAVRRWLQQAEADGSEDALSADEPAELQHLRKEVKELRMEKEILRKATAFFARESR